MLKCWELFWRFDAKSLINDRRVWKFSLKIVFSLDDDLKRNLYETHTNISQKIIFVFASKFMVQGCVIKIEIRENGINLQKNMFSAHRITSK